MNRFLGLASFGTALLALAMSLWGPRETVAAPAASAEQHEVASAEDVRALAKRVLALEDISQGLSRRLMELERRPAGAPGAAPVAGDASLAAEVAQLREEVRGLIVGEALHSPGGREFLKDAVVSAQEEMRAERRQQREQMWQQAQVQAQAKRAERVRQFVTDARLNYTQEQAFKSWMEKEDARRQALMDEMRAGTKSPRDARRELRALSEETDQEMKKVLSEDQLAKYKELRREERRDERPRGGGRQAGGNNAGR